MKLLLVFLSVLFFGPLFAQTVTTLSPTGFGLQALDFQLAMDDTGNAIVVWTEVIPSSGTTASTIVLQSSYKPAGGNWQQFITLSPTNATVNAFQLKMDDLGNAVVTWQLVNVPNNSNALAQAIYRPVGGNWQSVKTLSDTQFNVTSAPFAAIEGGNAAVTWQIFNGSINVAQVALHPTGTTDWQLPGTPSNVNNIVSFPNATISLPPIVDIDTLGNVIASWTAPVPLGVTAGVSNTIQAAFKPVGASYQRFILSQTGFGLNATSAPEISIENGKAVVVWLFQNSLSSTPSVVVQAAAIP